MSRLSSIPNGMVAGTMPFKFVDAQPRRAVTPVEYGRADSRRSISRYH